MPKITVHTGMTGSVVTPLGTKSSLTNGPLQTKWVAVVGAPCSGKTTTIQSLATVLGYDVIPDFARDIIAELRGEGLAQQEILNDPAQIQMRITKKMLPYIKHQKITNALLSDYGMPCYYAWHKIYGVEPDQDLISACDRWRYTRVFYLEPLPLVNDAERFDTASRQKKASEEIIKSYRYFGYDPVYVPQFKHENPDVSIARRVDFILDRLAREDDITLQPGLSKHVV